MNQQDTIKLFEEKQVRTVWDEDKEDGNETVAICHGLKMEASDGKLRNNL